MFVRQKYVLPGMGRVTIHEPDEPDEPEPMYDEHMFSAVVKKKPKYRPGERLLRSLHKKQRKRENNLDLNMIQRSMHNIISDLAKL